MQQGLVSDKTFHLKWNNHLQNLSQLFSTIYSSSALADVTLSCRDGTLKAHKLVLSACSPYFEQIFKDNPCQHPIVILKGIPFSEINLLVEFMYKGSVDVQEMDLQSLMHTASELEIRGLAYEARDNAAQMLNVNLEYPVSYTSTAVPTPSSFPQGRTDVERLKQIHMYQQSMMRAEEMRRRRRDEPGTHTAVNNILAAAAREMEEARNSQRNVTGIQTEHGLPHDVNNILAAAAREMEDARNSQRNVTGIQKEHGLPHDGIGTPDVKRENDEERPKKRVSILTSEDDRLKAKRKPQMTVRFQDDVRGEERPNKIHSPGPANDSKNEHDGKSGGIKVVQLSALQRAPSNEDDSDEKGNKDDDEETDSSGSMSDSAANEQHDSRPHVCDVCDQRFQRASHLSRHRLTHTGERPFTCGGCGRSFARSDKLRVHTKICERDDPTVDMSSDTLPSTNKRESSSEVMSGMVRTTHRESGHLVFTPSGDVMLPPRTASNPIILNSTLDAGRTDADQSLLDPPRRGRGRPRKTPLPLTPKIKKRRGRPPKTSLDMEGCVLTGGIVSPAPQQLATVTTPSGQQLLLKRKRGRPPKNFFIRPDGRPNENYNATNLPFGDFSYLTDMMYIPSLSYSYTSQPNDEQQLEQDNSHASDSAHERTIDVSDSSSDDEDPRVELEENVPQVGMETQIMTVGDCQIVKLPNNGEDKQESQEKIEVNNDPPVSTPSSVTITPITTVGDCTIRPVENNT